MKRVLVGTTLLLGLMIGCSDTTGPNLGSDDTSPHIVPWPAGASLRFTGHGPSGAVAVASGFQGMSHDSTVLYLDAGGIPTATLGTTQPTSPSLSNYDPERDSLPGLLLEKSAVGLDSEQDQTRYQQWLAAGPHYLKSGVQFVYWSAMQDFATSVGGSVQVGLYECQLDGTQCERFAAESQNQTPWGDGSPSWVERTIDFGDINRQIPANKALLLRTIVTDSSGDAMRFAFGAAPYPSRLTFESIAVGQGPKKIDWNFFAVRGQRRVMELTVVDENGNGNDIPFFLFDTSQPTFRPDGSEILDGDSVQITVTVDTTQMVVYLEPTGLQFDSSSTPLKLWYDGAGGDLNGDGTVDSFDAEVEEELSIWYQEDVTEPWRRLPSERSPNNKWIRVSLKHFSNYAVAW